MHQVKIAYEGNRCAWRVVTLSGQLIDKAGTMAGGGKEVKRGAMARTGNSAASCASSDSVGALSDEDVQRLSAAADAASEALRECHERREKLESELRALEGRMRKLDTLATQLEMQVTAADKSRTELQAREQELLPECELPPEAKRKLEGLRAEAAQKRATFENVESRAGSLTAQVQATKKVRDTGKNGRAVPVADSCAVVLAGHPGCGRPGAQALPDCCRQGDRGGR